MREFDNVAYGICSFHSQRYAGGGFPAIDSGWKLACFSFASKFVKN
jgi:hypothetical protein